MSAQHHTLSEPCSQSKLHTLAAIKTYGVPPSIVHHIALNNFSIHENYRDCFKHYYLLKWQTKFMLGQVTEGVIEHQGIEYVVVYYRITRGRLIDEMVRGIKPDVMLSFRKPQPEFGICGYVLVS